MTRNVVESNIYRWQSALRRLRKRIRERSDRLLSRFACLLATCPQPTMKFVNFCWPTKSQQLSFLSNANRSVNTGTHRSASDTFEPVSPSNRRPARIHRSRAPWILPVAWKTGRTTVLPSTSRHGIRRLKFKSFTTAGWQLLR